MSDDDDDRLSALTERLRGAARRLAEEELSPEQASELVDETARIAGEAAAELDRRARAVSGP